jgi:hypothetical protein
VGCRACETRLPSERVCDTRLPSESVGPRLEHAFITRCAAPAPADQDEGGEPARGHSAQHGQGGPARPRHIQQSLIAACPRFPHRLRPAPPLLSSTTLLRRVLDRSESSASTQCPHSSASQVPPLKCLSSAPTRFIRRAQDWIRDQCALGEGGRGWRGGRGVALLKGARRQVLRPHAYGCTCEALVLVSRAVAVDTACMSFGVCAGAALCRRVYCRRGVDKSGG